MNPVYDFSGRVALVTGAASGIGLAAAWAFARSGAKVILVDRDAAALDLGRELMMAEAQAVISVTCDVSVEEDVARAVATGLDAFGGLDMAFNAAGIIGAAAVAAEQDAAGFDRIMEVNARGVWVSMKHEIRAMRPAGGAIVNCASLAGLGGGAGYSAYHASKHAVIGLTKSAALEYAAQGIRINAVCPGVIDTPMVSGMLTVDEASSAAVHSAMAGQPIGRIGTADEIAAAALWLCSPAASLVIGVALPVDGGYAAH